MQSIYKEHIQRSIYAIGKCPEAFFRAAFLVIASIHVRSNVFWPNLSSIYSHYVESGHNIDLTGKRFGSIIYGFKRNSLNAFRKNLHEHYSKYKELNADEFHDYLCTLPGFGPAKAGFFIQLSYGEYGCIDAVNIRRFGIDKREFVNMCRRGDGPERYRRLFNGSPSMETVTIWREWTEYVAGRDKIYTAESLSEAHANFIETGETGLNATH